MCEDAHKNATKSATTKKNGWSIHPILSAGRLSTHPIRCAAFIDAHFANKSHLGSWWVIDDVIALVCVVQIGLLIRRQSQAIHLKLHPINANLFPFFVPEH